LRAQLSASRAEVAMAESKMRRLREDHEIQLAVQKKKGLSLEGALCVVEHELVDEVACLHKCVELGRCQCTDYC
jgi:hypothetical protein